MYQRITCCCLIILGLGLMSLPSSATGPSGFDDNGQVVDIQWILDNAKDDQYVTLRGRLTKYIGKDKYEFNDEKNQTIVVELDDDHDWSYISKDQPIEIVAEVDKDLMSLTLEVKTATPLP